MFIIIYIHKSCVQPQERCTLCIYSWTVSTDANSSFLNGQTGPDGKLEHGPKKPRIWLTFSKRQWLRLQRKKRKPTTWWRIRTGQQSLCRQKIIQWTAKPHNKHRKEDLERKQKTSEGNIDSAKRDYSVANKDTHVSRCRWWDIRDKTHPHPTMPTLGCSEKRRSGFRTQAKLFSVLQGTKAGTRSIYSGALGAEKDGRV